MCYFHLKQACRKYIFAHCSHKTKGCDEFWNEITKDIEILHNAQGIQDFNSRCRTIMTRWKEKDIDKITSWPDKKGIHHDFLLNFATEWLKARPVWYWGAAEAALATTNNQCENCVKLTRIDFGRCVQSATALVKFLLKQVEFESRREWSDHPREPDSKQWSKAVGFKELFKSDKVRIHGGCSDGHH